jgi:hypothetical protein
MSIKAGAVISKISEIRSKIAIFEGLILYLRTNYLSSDTGDAEMRYTRSDHASVPESHVESSIHELETTISEYRDQLEEWENLELNAEETVEGGKVRKKKDKGKDKKENEHASVSGDSDQPTAIGARRAQAG